MEFDDFLKVIRSRRDIWSFKTDPVPDEYIDKILEVVRWAMSGANGQPWEFVVVKNAELREKIVDIYRINTIVPISLQACSPIPPQAR